jgi:hypothetical protein
MSKPASKPTERRMEYVEITQAEEMPVLSAEEKAELIASIKEAEAQIERGECSHFASGEELGDWIKKQFDEAIARHHGTKD